MTINWSVESERKVHALSSTQMSKILKKLETAQSVRSWRAFMSACAHG